MRDGVFGASDEELSELSEHEIVAVPKKLFDTAPAAGAPKIAPTRVAKESGGTGRGRRGGKEKGPSGGEGKADEEVTDPSSGSESDRAPPVRGRGRKVVGSFASNPTATQQEKKAIKPSKHNKAPVKRRAVAEESDIDEDRYSGSESDRAPPVKGKGGRGRRVVSSFVSQGQIEVTPAKAQGTASSKGKPPKKKVTAKESEYEDDDDERPPIPSPQPAAATKTQTRPADRKSAPQPPKEKAAKQKRKEVVEEPMEEEEGGESPAPRRSTRASAAAASKKIAKVAAAVDSSQESGTGEGAEETNLPSTRVPPKVAAKHRETITKTKGRCLCSCCLLRRLK